MHVVLDLQFKTGLENSSLSGAVVKRLHPFIKRITMVVKQDTI